MNMIKKTLGQRGFTLLEVMIALSIFSVGILAVVAMQGQAILGNAAAQSLSNASALAQERMERIMEMPFTAVAVGVNNTTVGQYTVTETFTDPIGGGLIAANARVVAINVTWQGPFGQAHSVPLSFVRTQNMESSYGP